MCFGSRCLLAIRLPRPIGLRRLCLTSVRYANGKPWYQNCEVTLRVSSKHTCYGGCSGDFVAHQAFQLIDDLLGRKEEFTAEGGRKVKGGGRSLRIYTTTEKIIEHRTGVSNVVRCGFVTGR